MNVFWYMCAPDGAYPWQPEGSRKVDLGYYKQLARPMTIWAIRARCLRPVLMMSGFWPVRCFPIRSG